MKLLALLLALVAFATANYSFKGQFIMPYTGVIEDIEVNHDTQSQEMSVVYYGGLSTLRFSPSATFQEVVMKDHFVCRKFSGQSEEGMPTFLPDISGWKNIGKTTYKNEEVTGYVLEHQDDAKLNSYHFYMKGSTPVALVMMGYNTVFSSHYDHYILEYHHFTHFAKIAPIPSSCDSPVTVSAGPAPAGLRVMGSLKGLGQKRHSLFSSAMKSHMMSTKSFTIKPNQFSDMTHDEFTASYLTLRSARAARGNMASETAAFSEYLAPESWDWREHGLVNAVKDQQHCGSCFTFSTIAAVEGAYAVKTGKVERFSEQQLVNCGWTGGFDDLSDSAGCDGGQTWQMAEYMIKDRKIALEESVPYLGLDDFCNDNADVIEGVRVAKYHNITIGNEKDMKEALYRYGTLSVAIDVQESFIFYGEGVYYEPKCRSGYDDLGHAVSVVGYGSDPEGGDYWIVRNSWSTYWGDEGYIKMARNRNNNCGIATAVLYVTLE